MYILKIFSKKWILFTLFIAGMMALFAYLGFWQMERHAQKRSYNALLAERWRQEPLDLNQDTLPDDLSDLEYRRVTAAGAFDYANQLVLKSQVYRDASGIVLVTPFVFDDGRAILVARGWAPGEYRAPQRWPELEEPAGAPMIGLIRPSQDAGYWGSRRTAGDAANRVVSHRHRGNPGADALSPGAGVDPAIARRRASSGSDAGARGAVGAG
jgi:cytochrome oxidase assembly protein ShyY1